MAPSGVARSGAPLVTTAICRLRLFTFLSTCPRAVSSLRRVIPGRRRRKAAGAARLTGRGGSASGAVGGERRDAVIGSATMRSRRASCTPAALGACGCARAVARSASIARTPATSAPARFGGGSRRGSRSSPQPCRRRSSKLPHARGGRGNAPVTIIEARVERIAEIVSGTMPSSQQPAMGIDVGEVDRQLGASCSRLNTRARAGGSKRNISPELRRQPTR
jgi:hypothetical protein